MCRFTSGEWPRIFARSVTIIPAGIRIYELKYILMAWLLVMFKPKCLLITYSSLREQKRFVENSGEHHWFECIPVDKLDLSDIPDNNEKLINKKNEEFIEAVKKIVKSIAWLS